MSEFRQRAIEDVAEAMRCEPEILRGQMDVDPKLLCNDAEYKVYAVARQERVLELEEQLRLLAIAAHRLTSGHVYPKWENSGGGKECPHGIHEAIACARCDALAIEHAAEKVGLIGLAASAPEKASHEA